MQEEKKTNNSKKILKKSQEKRKIKSNGVQMKKITSITDDITVNLDKSYLQCTLLSTWGSEKTNGTYN